jgi:hypothetical protein
MPVVVLGVSRRIWVRGLKRATVKELSAYALPDGARTALRFTLRRQRDAAERGATYSYQPAPDFAPIARAYGLPLLMTGDEIVETGRSLASCSLLVNHKHGVGGRVETKHGVPDLDKMAAFRRAQDVLAPWEFRPWEGLAEIPTGKRAMKDRNQKWRDRDEDEDRRDAFERWQEEATADIAACYDGDHHIVVAYHPSCYGDAERAKALLGELLADHVRTQLIPIPSNVHGPRATLPRPALKAPRARDYATLRTEAWGHSSPRCGAIRTTLRRASTASWSSRPNGTGTMGARRTTTL